MVVPDPWKPGHCPGKILVNRGYCLRKLGCDIVAPPHVLPARAALKTPMVWLLNNVITSPRFARSNTHTEQHSEDVS